MAGFFAAGYKGTRAALAYQMTVFRQIYHSHNEIPAPLVIDTPNQQEQATQNYERIVKLIMEDTPDQSQVILCGMENQYLDSYKDRANIIRLDEHKLLNNNSYNELSEELSLITEAAKNGYNNANFSIPKLRFLSRRS